jgi:hypothetical protein
VDGCWNGGWFWSEASGKPSSGCRRWLSGLSSGLEHGGHQMLGPNILVLLDPKHGKNMKVS